MELWCRTFNTTTYYNIEEPLLFYRDPIQINIKKYEASSKTDRKIIRQYTKGIERVKLLFVDYIKINLYKLLATLNLSIIIYKRRNPRINQHDLLIGNEKLLQAIK